MCEDHEKKICLTASSYNIFPWQQDKMSFYLATGNSPVQHYNLALVLWAIVCEQRMGVVSRAGESFLLLRSIIAFGIKYLQEICLQD